MPEPPRIGSYEFGRIEIDGQTYTSDVVILPGGAKADWWRTEGHTLAASDLAAVLAASPQVLVIGQGAHGQMRVPDETLRQLRQTGIEVICAPTDQAVGIYNARTAGGGDVAAALHLTC
jgi:hypothetical protein